MALRSAWKIWCVLAGLGVLAAVIGLTAIPRRTPDVSPPVFPIRLQDVTAQTGITFRHSDGSGGQRYILESMSCGVATFDFDGDGLIDIYFLTGQPLRGTKAEGPPPKNRLYRNLGGFRFEDITDQAGIGDAGYGLGVCVADYNNDGFPDIYVSNFGPKVLYRNNGDGTFTDVTAQAGVADGSQIGGGVCFLDMDGDGNLDLYVANYVDFTYEKHVPEFSDGFPVYTSPKAYDPSRHTLYRNLGDGTFADASVETGIAKHLGPGMGAVCADYDNDGHTDIFVLNDGFGNFCWHNDGQGHFEEVGLVNGLKFNGDGAPVASMGVDCADYDNDGWFDFFETTYQGERPVLFRNLDGNSFEDVTRLTDVWEGGLNNVKWGCGFADFDGDGHKDIFYVNGHLQDNVEQYDRTTTYEGLPALLWNTGQGKFVNVSEKAGDGLKVKLVGRGLALDDLDNSGRIDVVILSSRRPAVVLKNDSPLQNHWLEIQLRGVKTNRDGVGARVRVSAGDLTQIDEVHSGRGYQSHFGTRLHFGMGTHDRVDRIEIRWIGGGVDVVENISADQLLTIWEGGEVQPTPPSARP